MSLRAFVALPLPEEPAFARLLASLQATRADVKATDPAHMHVTLAFLGDVPDDAPAALADALDEAVAGARPFTLQLHGVGAFPNPQKARVVWMGARACPPLDELAHATRAAVIDAGYEIDEKDFRVHVTLGRTRSPQGLHALTEWLKRHADEPLPQVRVDHVRLYRSHLGPGGPKYETLHVAKLEG